DLAKAILEKVRSRWNVSQAFLFDGDGDPFWPARVPVTPEEVRLLVEAVDLAERLERQRPKPFIGHDPSARFSALAVSAQSNLYAVCLGPPDRVSAEQRLQRIQEHLASDIEDFQALRRRLGSS